MIWTVKEEWLDKDSRKHAGGKARADLDEIFSKCGFTILTLQTNQHEREEINFLGKAVYHFKVADLWRNTLSVIKNGDTLVLQFPVINHTLLFNGIVKQLKKRGVTIYAFIHDLEILRRSKDSNYSVVTSWRMKREELDELKEFDGIVVHNIKMKEYMESTLEINGDKMIVLNIFDYMLPDNFEVKESVDNYRSCIVAGNLDKRKSGYVYGLPESPEFELYGVNYGGDHPRSNVHYHGSFMPDDLPFHLVGGFGLVWDGDSADTCTGAWGEYLRFNNPHKTSLYLACGIPVMIWEEAALADYVLKENVGITIKSLSDINKAVNEITPKQYSLIKNNAAWTSNELRSGCNTKRVLKELGLIERIR